jgi:hypothetical protein
MPGDEGFEYFCEVGLYAPPSGAVRKQFQRLHEGWQVLLDQRHKQIYPIVKVNVERAVRHPRFACDLPGGCSRQPLSAQDSLGSLENLPARLPGPRPRAVRFFYFLSDALIIAAVAGNSVKKNDQSLTRNDFFRNRIGSFCVIIERKVSGRSLWLVKTGICSAHYSSQRKGARVSLFPTSF